MIALRNLSKDVQRTGGVPLRHGEATRERMRKRNHCASETASTGDGCIRYLHCAEGFPVVWCETQGLGHNIAGEPILEDDDVTDA